MGRQTPIRLLLAGCDPDVLLRVAPALVKAVQCRPGLIELTAVYDAIAGHAQTARQKFGFARAESDIEQAFRTGAPGAVVCAIPAAQGSRDIPALLRRGVPTALVPPLGRSLEDALAIGEAARESSAPHMVAMPRRFSPYLGRAVRWARQLGPIRQVHGRFRTPGQVDGPFVWNAALGAIDAVGHILGRIDGFELTAAEGPGSAAAVSLRFADGAQGRLELAGRADHTEESYELLGEGYHAVVVLGDLAGPSMQCWRGPKIEVRIQAPADQPAVEYDGMQQALSAFMDALLSGQRPGPTLEEVLPAMDLAQRITAGLTPVPAA